MKVEESIKLRLTIQEDIPRTHIYTPSKFKRNTGLSQQSAMLADVLQVINSKEQ